MQSRTNRSGGRLESFPLPLIRHVSFYRQAGTYTVIGKGEKG